MSGPLKVVASGVAETEVSADTWKARGTLSGPQDPLKRRGSGWDGAGLDSPDGAGSVESSLLRILIWGGVMVVVGCGGCGGLRVINGGCGGRRKGW